ncbi:helix-turn-helix domain-containing protein, partial [Mycolicibacterium phlei]|uniref:helix-turn-helix domain-containing protein n=1 Tax=Mycolicibacterium phlei TaxID=1771 RepID=UPI0037CC65D8
MDTRTVATEARLRAEAERQHLSARQLSDSTGIAYSTVQGILTGTREPKLTHLYLLADALLTRGDERVDGRYLE